MCRYEKFFKYDQSMLKCKSLYFYAYIFVPCKYDIQNAPSKANLVLGRFMDRMQQRVVIATVGVAGGAPTGIGDGSLWSSFDDRLPWSALWRSFHLDRQFDWKVHCRFRRKKNLCHYPHWAIRTNQVVYLLESIPFSVRRSNSPCPTYCNS